jgi:hypothetical protein
MAHVGKHNGHKRKFAPCAAGVHTTVRKRKISAPMSANASSHFHVSLGSQIKQSRMLDSYSVSFQILMAASMKLIVFWDVAAYSVVEVFWLFRGSYCLCRHLPFLEVFRIDHFVTRQNNNSLAKQMKILLKSINKYIIVYEHQLLWSGYLSYVSRILQSPFSFKDYQSHFCFAS